MFKSKRINSIVEGLLNEEEDEQRNRVVLEAYPVMFGFKEILPGASSFISSSFYPKFHSSSIIFSSLLLKGIFNASSLSNSSQTLYRKANKAYYWPCGPAAQTGVEHVRPPYPYPFGRRTDGSLKNP